MRSNMEGKDVFGSYKLMQSKTNTAFKKFLLGNNSIRLKALIFARYNLIKVYNFRGVITLFVNPERTSAKSFIELLYGQESRLATDKIRTTKLAFATELKSLEEFAKAYKANTAKYLFKWVLGFQIQHAMVIHRTDAIFTKRFA